MIESDGWAGVQESSQPCMVGRRRASIALPLPGGATKSRLWSERLQAVVIPLHPVRRLRERRRWRLGASSPGPPPAPPPILAQESQRERLLGSAPGGGAKSLVPATPEPRAAPR